MKLYETLGVSKGASKDDVRKAYKRLAVQHHPDKGGDADKFKDISHAYEVLTNDEKRSVYDRVGDEGFTDAMNGASSTDMHMSMDPNELFQQMFHNFGGFGMGGFGMPSAPKNVRRKDHIHNMCVTLDQAYQGFSKSMKINVSKPCFKCSQTCNACQGRGSITDMHRNGIFTTTMTRPCHVCNGSGKQQIPQDSCTKCHGSGHILTDHVHELKVPAGVVSGFQVRIPGLGEQAQTRDEVAGDMIIHINVEEHPIFSRTGKNGQDLVFKNKMSFTDTILGTTISVPHFAETFVVDTASYGIIVPGKKYCIKGKGMKEGDMFIVFEIVYQNKVLTDENRRLLRDAFGAVGLIV
jgi:DnaJ-class molecular chaperone